MFERGLKFPLQGDDAVKRIVIGGIVSLLSVLIIPAFVLMGYFVRVLEAGHAGDTEPPEWTDWGELLVQGLVATGIGLIYSIVPLILLFVTLTFTAAGAAEGGAAGGILGGAGLLGMLVGFLLLVVVYYAIPAALTNYAVEGEFGAAFDADALKPVLFSADYLVAWLMPFVLAFVLNIIGGILFVTVVGIVLLPFIQYYGYVAVFYMFGAAFADVAAGDSAAAGAA